MCFLQPVPCKTILRQLPLGPRYGAPDDHRPVPGDGCGCALSTCGHWYGPVICYEAELAVLVSVVLPHRERFHVNAPKHHHDDVQGTLLPALVDLHQFYLVHAAVEEFEQLPA